MGRGFEVYEYGCAIFELKLLCVNCVFSSQALERLGGGWRWSAANTRTGGVARLEQADDGATT